jgi:periplasmic protein TonB
VPARERLVTLLFLAAVAHGIVILGLSFGNGSRNPGAAPGMEVLLVTEDLPAAHRNERAAYLAQRTQIGSGNTRTQPTGSPEAHAEAAPESLLGGLEHWAAAAQESGDERTLSTSASQPVIVWLGQAGRQATATMAERQLDAGNAPRHGRGDAPELVLRGDPKTGQWVSPDTKASNLAPYLDAWRRKVERVGTLNFPSEARRADYSGSPVIEVALASDGRLLEATIQRPSSHPEIDAAALHILRLASPFERFPPALARSYGSVRFAYQWEFSGGQLGTGTVSAETEPDRSP